MYSLADRRRCSRLALLSRQAENLAFTRKRVRSSLIEMCVTVGCFLAASHSAAAGAPIRAPLTVSAAIDTARIMASAPGAPLSFSPGHTRFVMMLLRGELAKNDIVADLVAGSTQDWEHATHPYIAARLRTSGLSGFRKSQITLTTYNQFRWLDDENVTFLWNDDSNIAQVVSVNVRTRSLTYLTRHGENIEAFDAGEDGTVVYSAFKPPSKEESSAKFATGFSVDSDDANSLLLGNVGSAPWGSYGLYVQRRGVRIKRIVLEGAAIDRSKPEIVSLSPNGRYAVVDAAPAKVPSSWSQYDDRFLQLSLQVSQNAQASQSSFLRQFFFVDLDSGVGKPLLNAPKALRAVQNVSWSPDSAFVAFAPAFLPIESDTGEAGRRGQAIAVVNVATSAVRQLIPPKDVTGTLHVLRWTDDGIVVGKAPSVDTGNICFHGEPPNSTPLECGARVRGGGVRVAIREDIEQPPQLYAYDGKTGQRRLIWDPNPNLLSDYKLGHVEDIQWRDKDGRKWHGRLYFPTDYRPDKAYPLVVQLHGVPGPHTFSLYGYDDPLLSVGLGPGVSIYAAQPLAGRGMFVLQANDNPSSEDMVTNQEAAISMSGIDSGIRELATHYPIDLSRVGLAGWSHSGWHVEYSLSHSDFPYAAALVSDSADGSYVQGALNGSGPAGLEGEFAWVNGGPPFGEGIGHWLSSAPGFTSNRIRTPLRLQVEGGLYSILAPWELFNALRLQKMPVEMYIIPDLAHGTHLIQNPRQCLASQGGAVDWFDFWLNGHEDVKSPSGVDYVRWRGLRQLRDSVLSEKRPPALQWSYSER